jgi:hypothetical protein
MGIFQISKLEYPIALGMGIGSKQNVIDALPNNHGLTLPNKKWRGQLAFQWTFSMIGGCIRGGGGGQQNTCRSIFDEEMFDMQRDNYFFF